MLGCQDVFEQNQGARARGEATRSLCLDLMLRQHANSDLTTEHCERCTRPAEADTWAVVQVMAANAAAKLLRKMSPAIAAAALTMRASAEAPCRVVAPDTRSVAVGTSPTLEAGALQAMTNSPIQAACTRSVAVGTSPMLEAGGLQAMTNSFIQAALQTAATAAAQQVGSALQRKCEVLQAALSEQLAAAVQHHRQAHQQLGEDVVGRITTLQDAQGQQLEQVCTLAQQQGRAHESLHQGLSQVLTALEVQVQTKQRPALEQSPSDIATHGEHKPRQG